MHSKQLKINLSIIALKHFTHLTMSTLFSLTYQMFQAHVLNPTRYAFQCLPLGQVKSACLAKVVVTPGILKSKAASIPEGHAGEHAVKGMIITLARCLTHDARLLQQVLLDARTHNVTRLLVKVDVHVLAEPRGIVITHRLCIAKGQNNSGTYAYLHFRSRTEKPCKCMTTKPLTLLKSYTLKFLNVVWCLTRVQMFIRFISYQAQESGTNATISFIQGDAVMTQIVISAFH